MRYPESVIRAAFSHDDHSVREYAFEYFTKSYSTDPSIMIAVIEAIERYGREKSTRLLWESHKIAQSPESVRWLIGELNKPKLKESAYSTYIEKIVKYTDLQLLIPAKDPLLAATHLTPKSRETLAARLEMQAWDWDTCWRKLEEFCEENKSKRYIGDINHDYCDAIVESLARFGMRSESRILELLSQEIEDHDDNPLGWLEGAVIDLAGRIRLESAVPVMLGKLNNEAGDLVTEGVQQSLIQVNTPAVIEAIRKAYYTTNSTLQLFTTEALNHIHCDEAVVALIELIQRMDTETIDYFESVCLFTALIGQFPINQIELPRQYLLQHDEIEGEDTAIRDELVFNCSITGEHLPELEKWRAERIADQKRIEERSAKFEQLMNQATVKPALPPVAPRPIPSYTDSRSTPIPRDSAAGRNDPCPCGSGKKYKKCCLKN